MSLILDVDGTLVDSRNAVYQAYMLCGVSMPHDAWGMSWRDWLPDMLGSRLRAEVIHEAKNRKYVECLARFATILEPTYVAHEFISNNVPVSVVSTASERAVKAVLKFTELEGQVDILGTELDQETRLGLIESRAIGNRGARMPTIYIDDEPGIVKYIREANVPQLDAILFRPKHTKTFRDKVVNRWMELSSQLGVTRGSGA